MSAPPRHPLFGLLASECLRTFSDNVLRVVVILLLIGRHDTETEIQKVTTETTVAYTIPWILLSLFAGQIADRFSKRSVLRALKLAEVFVMLLAAAVLADGRAPGLFFVVALVGTLSALASPSKYGILPELLPTERLQWGNGQLLLGTYVAIVSGTALGGILLDLARDRPGIIGLLLAAVAGLGFRASSRIPVVPPARRKGGALATLREGASAIRGNARLRLGLIGNVAYWALAALVSQNLLVYAQSELGLSDTGKGLLLTAVAVGIGLGGAAAGTLGRGRIVLAHVPAGAAAMAAAAAVIGLVHPGFTASLLLLPLLGAGAGFVVVPISALIEDQSPAAARGAVLAVMNVVIFAGIIAGSATAWGLAEAHLSSPAIFLTTAILLATLSLYAALRAPRILARGRPPRPTE